MQQNFPLLQKKKKIKKTLSVALIVGDHDQWDKKGALPAYMNAILQFNFLVISYEPDSTAQFKSSSSEDFLHSLILLSSGR